MYCLTLLNGAPPTDPAKSDPDQSFDRRQYRAPNSGNSCRIRRDDTPFREFTRWEIATFGGKFTNRCTWLSSPLNSTSSTSKSVHTSRITCSSLIGWGHTCRAIWNAALVQRQILWRERRWTLRSARQCGELTEARAAFHWVADLPAQCAQQILRAMDQAYDNWWNPQHPADAPA